MFILTVIILWLSAIGLTFLICLGTLIKQYVDFSNSVEGKETISYWDDNAQRFCMFVAMRIMQIGEKNC